jgi:hypothetical protein
MLLALSLAACDAGTKAGTTPAAKSGEAEQAKDDPPRDESKEATFANPKVEPPPAPAGAIALADPWLYVQTCAEPHPCKELEQPAGDEACRELRLGNYEGWRLPSRSEVERFADAPGLDAKAGYHWTRTPFEDDVDQVWIVDPSGEGPATTIPRTRKPFKVRCVKEP